MALLFLLPFLSMASLLTSPGRALTCTSQKFTNNKVYTNCTDLPTLKSYLHWTYDAGRSSLSIAFVAPPASSSGWVAWGINPTGTGMAGTQALIALRGSNGSVTVGSYNISSYISIVPSELSFGVSNSTAEHSGGVMRIFATLSLPKNMTTVNQVWQVGASVTNGMPVKHKFDPENLNAKGTLELVRVATLAPVPAPAAAPSNGTTGGGSTTPTTPSTSNGTTSTPTGSGSGACSIIKERSAGIYVTSLVLGSLLLAF